MIRTNVIRLYPTRAQEAQLNNTAGACRFAWNKALGYWDEQYEAHLKDKSIPKPTSFKVASWYKDNREEWASETSSVCQRQEILHLGKAFGNYSKRPDHFAHPKFHKKGIKDSFEVPNDRAKIKDGRVMLPKIGEVKMAEPLRYQGKICSYTVKKSGGSWYVHIPVETGKDERVRCANPESVVGIDVGLLNPAVASDGTKLELPKETLDKLDAKLRRQQKALSRSQRNSRNHAKLLVKKQRTQNKINNIRKDAVHKFTTAIAKSHGKVVIEDLDIKEMKDKAPARNVRRAYNSSLMNTIHWQLSYKVQHLIKVNRFFPSSKTCSNCGHIRSDLDLSERTYHCDHCGAVIDRDLNASINLMKSGLVKPDASVEQVGTSLR